jgi:hypothetical protein
MILNKLYSFRFVFAFIYKMKIKIQSIVLFTILRNWIILILMKNKIKMLRSSISFDTLNNHSDEKEYWKTKNYVQRLEALEFLRQSVYNYDHTTRLQRIFSISKLK